MKTRWLIYLAVASALSISRALAADQAAHVTESVNEVVHGTKADALNSPAPVGTAIIDGQYLKTEARARAELTLPSATVTRLGAETIFNYSADSNRVDLQEGTILFCKPKEARQLSIRTAAVTAGITGTTGFVSITGEGSKKTYIFGIIEGHATATGTATGARFEVGPGDILEFRPGLKPFMFPYDVPRFVKSTPLIHKFTGTLPNQAYIDREIASYQDDVSRGFIQPPSKQIDYDGYIPIITDPAFDSAQAAQGQSQQGDSSSSGSSRGNNGGYGRNGSPGNNGNGGSNFH